MTRSNNPHFYEVENGILTELLPKNFANHEICQPTLKIRFALPWEICSVILHHLFELHLWDQNFDLAAAMIPTCKAFVKENYLNIYGPAIDTNTKKRKSLAYMTMLKRTRNTLYLLEQIHGEFVSEKRKWAHPNCCIIKRSGGITYTPWRSILDCYTDYIEGPLSRHNDDPLHQFTVGPLNGDIVWLLGDYDSRGLFQCKAFQHPIINLTICTYGDQNSITSDYLMTNVYFTKFVALIKRSYGPNTAVNVAYDDSKDDNPFDVSRRGYISF